MAAEVVLAERLGDASVLHLRVAGLSELFRAKIGLGQTDCQAGQTVMLQADVGAALWFDGPGMRVIRSS